MDLSLQLAPLPPWRSHHQSWLCTSPSQIGLISRKSQLRSIRCSARDGSAEPNPASADVATPGSLSKPGARVDPYSGWTSSEARGNGFGSSAVAGFLKFGGVLMLSVGFSLGARSLQLRKEAKRELLTPPAIEQTIPKVSEEKNTETPSLTTEQDDSAVISNDNENVTVVPETVEEKHVDKGDDLQVKGVPEKIQEKHVDKGDDLEVKGVPEKIEEKQPAPDDASVATAEDVNDGPSMSIPENEVTEDSLSVHVVDTHISDTEHYENIPEDITSNDNPVVADAGQTDRQKELSASEDLPNQSSEEFSADVGDETQNDKLLSEEDVTSSPLLSDSTTEGAQDLDFKENNENISDSNVDVETSPPELERNFSFSGLIAPCTPPANLPKPGKIVMTASPDHMQEHVFSALQALKVIEAGVDPTSICTRREYARWLIAASSILSRSPAHKVFPAMYIENVSKLAYDDVLPDDQDFPFIQGLAEAGLISSRLLSEDISHGDINSEESDLNFSPDSPLTRQDLVTWRKALEQRPASLIGVSSATVKENLQQASGFMDIDKINEAAWLPLLVDVNAGERSIIALAFGYTRRFQPEKPVTKAQAAIALASGEAWELVSEELARLEADSIAEAAVTAELALETRAQEEVAAAYQERLQLEKEKQEAVSSMLEKAMAELKDLKAEWEEEKNQLLKERAVLESEREFLLNMRREVEGQSLSLSNERLQVSFEKEKAENLHAQAEEERAAIIKIRSELEIEKNALALARTWAEEEAKKALAHLKALEEIRRKWEVEGTRVIKAEEELPQAKDIQAPTSHSSEQFYKKINVDSVNAKMRELGQMIINTMIRFFQYVQVLFLAIKQRAIELSGEAGDKLQSMRITYTDSATKTIEDLRNNVPSSVAGMTSTLKENTLKAVDGWKEGAERFVQKLKIT